MQLVGMIILKVLVGEKAEKMGYQCCKIQPEPKKRFSYKKTCISLKVPEEINIPIKISRKIVNLKKSQDKIE